MNFTVQVQDIGPAEIDHYPLTAFTTITTRTDAGRCVLFFRRTDDVHELDAAQAWLQDALDKVQVAKAEAANAAARDLTPALAT